MIKCNRMELIAVPNIRPISDLRNDTDVLKEVDVSSHEVAVKFSQKVLRMARSDQ